MRNIVSPGVRLGLSAAAFAIASAVAGLQHADEPCFESAKNWWPPLRNVWTAVGVKNHPFRFTLLYNGTIVAEPHPLRNINGPIKTYLLPYVGLGTQLTFTPSLDGSIPGRPDRPYQLSDSPDGGVGLQQWDDDHAAPVLITRWPITHYSGNSGVVLHEKVFAHTPGGQAVQTGKEPLYLWIRLEVAHVDPLEATPSAIMMIHVGNPDMMQRSMWHEDNLTVHPQQAIYPRTLVRDAYQQDQFSCCRLVEPDGKIRLIGKMASGSAMLVERSEGSRDYYLKVEMPSVAGTHVDLLLPMIPGDADAVRAEADLGFDGALAESDRYWSQRPSTAAVVDTPEPQVNRAVRRMIELAQVISETNPESGERSLLTGSWNYDTLWPTPTCMAAHMLLDQLGYHQFVADNLEIFRNHQGQTKPPGEAYSLHPGYFGAPRQLSSIDWLTDHGSVLHSVAEHALVTGDEQFIAHWIDPVLKACEFLRDSRANGNHDGVKGVLPPAVSTDTGVPAQAIWNIAWNYKGLDSAVRLLKRIGHPAAEEYETEAQEYKERFVEAYRQHAAQAPTWTDAAGASRVVVPTELNGPPLRSHPFYLDAGPPVLVYAGLMGADDPLIQDSLAFYREGPNTKLYDPRGNMHERPVLTHEISSCEPCYSFNNVCSWQAGDRAHFIEGVYGLLAGGISQQTFSGFEHRHGICSLPAPGALMFYCMKLAVIDDAIKPDELHLLRLVPLAWVREDYRTRFENMPTEYGPVDLAFQLADDGRSLNVSFEGRWRRPPARVALHAPPVPGLSKITVNGQDHAAGEVIELSP
ncbi:MAG: hypothetical protein IT424_05845 [Pirellulales bacterium]|nr:hypothetical protein [Pirellulales bacterium]